MAQRERIFFDSWELTDGVARDWETFDGMDGASPYAGINTVVPGQPGELWAPKRIGAGSFTLNVWLAGQDRNELMEQWRTLLRAARRPHRQVAVRRIMPSGEELFARSELAGAIEPTYSGGQGMRAQLTWSVSSGVWESATHYPFQTAPGSPLPQTLALTDLAASTAVMDKGYWTVMGPITNPSIVDVTDEVDGSWVTYHGTIPAGQGIAYDAGLFIIRGVNGFVPNPCAVAYNGPRFMSVPAPIPGGVPKVQLRGEGAGPGTLLDALVHRAYVC